MTAEAKREPDQLEVEDAAEAERESRLKESTTAKQSELALHKRLLSSSDVSPVTCPCTAARSVRGLTTTTLPAA